MTPRATLTREPSTDEGTFGTIVLDTGAELYSVELPWRDNQTGISCIPLGVYRCEIYNSPKHGRVYLLQHVPGRSSIEIHVANFGGDRAKGWHSELLGCIAPATAIGHLQNPAGHAQRAGIQSGRAFHDLMAWAQGLPFQLEIRSPTAPKGHP